MDVGCEVVLNGLHVREADIKPVSVGPGARALTDNHTPQGSLACCGFDPHVRTLSSSTPSSM